MYSWDWVLHLTYRTWLVLSRNPSPYKDHTCESACLTVEVCWTMLMGVLKLKLVFCGHYTMRRGDVTMPAETGPKPGMVCERLAAAALPSSRSLEQCKWRRHGLLHCGKFAASQISIIYAHPLHFTPSTSAFSERGDSSEHIDLFLESLWLSWGKI